MDYSKNKENPNMCRGVSLEYFSISSYDSYVVCNDNYNNNNNNTSRKLTVAQLHNSFFLLLNSKNYCRNQNSTSLKLKTEN
jgi:hypothetical protein